MKLGALIAAHSLRRVDVTCSLSTDVYPICPIEPRLSVTVSLLQRHFSATSTPLPAVCGQLPPVPEPVRGAGRYCDRYGVYYAAIVDIAALIPLRRRCLRTCVSGN